LTWIGDVNNCRFVLTTNIHEPIVSELRKYREYQMKIVRIK